MQKEIYLDNAAATYVRSEVKVAMLPFFDQIYANPGSYHSAGKMAKEAVDLSRQKIIDLIGAKEFSEIIFTGTATESVNLAILGIAREKKKGHIITSKIEHESVLATCRYLEKDGFKVTYLDVDGNGLVSVDDFSAAIRSDTILASIMFANNEIGTIQPIKELAKISKSKGVLFHTDACQAGGCLDINVNHLGVDLMTLNASKMYGPKGIGILYVKKGIKIQPIIHGGGQENGLRSGTLNVPGIVGFATSLELAQSEREDENKRLIILRDELIKNVMDRIPDVILNGHPTKRLPNNINLSILNVDSEALMLHLNEGGIYCSSGSACSADSNDPSHVLLAIGVSENNARSSIRFTLGKQTNKENIIRVVDMLIVIIESLRKLSPKMMVK